jgi:hypothetical protein
MEGGAANGVGMVMVRFVGGFSLLDAGPCLAALSIMKKKEAILNLNYCCLRTNA